VDPGSEWRRHRDWFLGTVLGDLLGEDFGLVAKDNPYRRGVWGGRGNPSSATIPSPFIQPNLRKANA
jgi:hypothetical protein